MLTTNVDVSDGFVNGAREVVHIVTKVTTVLVKTRASGPYCVVLRLH